MSLRQKNHVTLKFDFIKLYSFNYLILRLFSQNQCYDIRVLTQTKIEITQSISLLDGWMDGWMDERVLGSTSWYHCRDVRAITSLS